MTDGNPDEILAAWRRRRGNSPLAIDSRCIQSIRLLAEGHPVAAEQIASASRVAVDGVHHWLNQIRAGGAEFDTRGNLVGCVLSLNATSYLFRVNGRDLYAWCALDTLFLPALLQQPAQVESTCPTTGAEIRLIIAPEGVKAVEPASTVVSVVVPGITPDCAQCARAGPQSPVCSQMHFFSSREAASTWLVAHPGVAVLSVDEAWQLADAVWVEPSRDLGEY